MGQYQTSPALPADYGRVTARHDNIAAAMRETDDWVLVGAYKSRSSAGGVAQEIRSGRIKAYRGHVYDARAITTADGIHQVWGQWIGPRGARR